MLFLLCLLFSLTSNLDASTNNPPQTKPVTSASTDTTTHKKPITTPTEAPTPTYPHQSSLTHKLNQLLNYIYTGLDYIADGQKNLSVTQHTNQRITILSLDQVKLQHNLLMADLKTFSGVIRWEQKGNHDVLKWTLETAFEALKLEFHSLVTEQRNLRADQKLRLHALKMGQSNLTAGLDEQQSYITVMRDELLNLKAEQQACLDEVKMGKKDLTVGQGRQQSAIIALSKQLGDMKSENAIVSEQIKLELKNLKSELTSQRNDLKSQLNEVKMKNDVLHLELKNLKSELTSQRKELKGPLTELKSQLNDLKVKNALQNNQIHLELKNLKSELNGQRNDLKSQLNDMKAKNALIQLGMKNLKSELKDELNDLKAKNILQKDQIQLGMKNLKSELNSQRNDHKGQLNGLKGQLTDLKGQLTDLKAENAILKSQIELEHKTTNAELAKLQNGQGQCAMKSQIEAMMKVVGTLVKAIPRCEAGWHHFEGRCYLFVTTSATRHAARSGCYNRGAELIRIRSEKHNDFIVKIMKKFTYNYLWIGLRRRHGVVMWSDGTKYTDGYYKFKPGYPDNRDCVYLYHGDAMWASYRCTNRVDYVCEKPHGSYA